MAERVHTQCFVVVGAIVEQQGKILLVEEVWKSTDQGKWNQPAGWLDLGENPVQAAEREVKEETGLDFQATGLLGIYSLVRKDKMKGRQEFPHPIKLVFRGRITGGEIVQGGEEIGQVKWFTPEEIEVMDKKTLRDLDIKQEVKDYFAGKNYPLDIIRHTVQN